MTVSLARRTSWRVAWLAGALGAVSLASLVHGFMDPLLHHSPAMLLLHALVTFGLLAVSVRIAARALQDSGSKVLILRTRKQRWETLEPLNANRRASRAA